MGEFGPSATTIQEDVQMHISFESHNPGPVNIDSPDVLSGDASQNRSKQLVANTIDLVTEHHLHSCEADVYEGHSQPVKVNANLVGASKKIQSYQNILN